MNFVITHPFTRRAHPENPHKRGSYPCRVAFALFLDSVKTTFAPLQSVTCKLHYFHSAIMDVDDDDDFYAPAEDTPDGNYQHEQQTVPQTQVKSLRPEEDLEEGEEEDEGEDDGSDSVRLDLVTG